MSFEAGDWLETNDVDDRVIIAEREYGWNRVRNTVIGTFVDFDTRYKCTFLLDILIRPYM